LLQANVEDLQIAYGLDASLGGSPSAPYTGVMPYQGTPNFYLGASGTTATTNTGFSPIWGLAPSASVQPQAALRTIRVNVVARSTNPIVNSGQGNSPTTTSHYAPLIVENHTPTTTADGYLRTLYTRTIALPNLMPAGM
jgi:hypothetical protein